MQVDVIIDRVLPYPHPNRQGLSYGQLALLFVAYVLSLRNHRLCAMEEWGMVSLFCENGERYLRGHQANG